jgi:hypothetical protein
MLICRFHLKINYLRFSQMTLDDLLFSIIIYVFYFLYL